MSRSRGRAPVPAAASQARTSAVRAGRDSDPPLRALQRGAGNRATAEFIARLGAPTVRPTGDRRAEPPEVEARSVAARVAAGGVAPTRPSTLPSTGPAAPGGGPAADRAVGGTPLDGPTRSWFEERLGTTLGDVRLHTDSAAADAAAALSARAFTVGRDVVFGAGQFAPDTPKGQRLLAHELTHVMQQNGQPVAVQCDDVIEVELITSLTEYTPPRSRTTYRVGDAAASKILMKIEQDGAGDVRFFWFNFAVGEPASGTWEQWDFFVGAATIGMNSRVFAEVGKALTPAQWESLWPDPRKELLRLHEQKKITIPAGAIVGTYEGMIHNQALQSLAENEKAIDALLGAPDRIAFFTRYAQGLREASVVRDALETRKAEVARSMAQMQGFSVGMAGRVVGMNPARRLQQSREFGEIDQALDFWKASFPLLSRLRTENIRADSVEATLRAIKRNIIDARAQLALAVRGRGPLDLWELDNVRAQVDTMLGPRARAAIADEDSSRRHSGWLKAGAGLVLGIALLFVPGGAFIDAAIGVAMGADAIDHAEAVGKAANTGLDVDAGLMSRAAAAGATFEAVLATVFGVLGAAGIGFRVLRVSRMLLRVREAAPALELAAQVRIARVLADHPGWLRAGGNLGELERAMARAGGALRFEELRLLRSLVYRAQGAALPAHSAESLAEFLQRVWAGRDQIARAERNYLRDAERRGAAARPGRGGQRAVYRIYSTATEANPLTRSASGYLDEAAEIARGRPTGAISNVQSTGEKIVDLARHGRLTVQGHGTDFLRFERAGANLREVGERVYVNANADHATDLMRRVVRDIVDNPREFPGTRMAKLTGPVDVPRRADAIVIYVTDASEASRVVDRLRRIQSATPDMFRHTTPAMTEQVLEGVSLGSEPLAAAGGISFGDLRSRAVYQALESTMRSGGGPEDFARAVAERLRALHVDPQAPHLNLPGGGS
ncbi:MAG TPA: DUF4157 domain-containing protein [Actinomycetales bacterium]|nr:DUF4157 domain-containing protein [Actinomycetales bacterium]